MNWLDGVILAIIAVSTYWSYRLGFLLEVAMFLGVLIGLLSAFLGYPYVTPFFEGIFESHHYGATVSFIALFLIVGGVISITGVVAQKFIEAIKLGGLDRFLGALLGFTKAVIGLSVALVIVAGLQTRYPDPYIRDSALARPVVKSSTFVMEQVPSLFQEFVDDYGKHATKWMKRLETSSNGS
ncbi:MAG: CvpA family protein [bacterium]